MKHAWGGALTPGRAVGWSVARGLSIAGFLVALPQVALADSDILANALVTTTGGYSSNPFNDEGSDTGSAYVETDVKPQVQWASEHNVILLDGNFDYKHYLRDYSDTIDYRADLDYKGAASSRLATHANASFDSSIIGGLDSLSSATSVDQSQPTTGTDVSLIGSRERRRAINFLADATYALSTRDTFTANAYYDISQYSGQGTQASLQDYDGYGGGVSYARKVSENLQLGAQALVARYVYSAILGETNVYTLQGTVSDKFGDTWSVNGALGVSRVERTIGGKSTNATGNLSVCRNGERLTLCLTASDAILPTGSTGTVNDKSLMGRASYVLNEHSTVSLSGGYTHNSSPDAELIVAQAFNANSYVTTAATYERILRERIHLVASTHYRKTTGGSEYHAQDIGGSIGISIHFGEYR